jgi:transposase
LVRVRVIHAWQRLSQTQRKELRRLAMRAKDAGMRCRCKVVLALVQSTTPTMIAQGGLCAKSQVYRIAERFITEGLAGLADRREDNGERKITRVYESEVLRLVEESPREFGYRRPTWTQELLILVLAERVDIAISVSAMSRLLSRLGIGLKRPKPIVNCPWKKAHRTRRLRAIQQLVANLPADEVVLYLDEVDIHLNPKIGPDWTKRGRQKEVLTPGCNCVGSAGMGQTWLLVKLWDGNENCEWIYRVRANPGEPWGGIVPPSPVLAPGAALGSRPRVALSSAQASSM